MTNHSGDKPESVLHLLEGVTVIDTTMNLPGPLAGHVLASLGARVIKVVPPSGDPAAAFPTLNQAINGLKEQMILDLKKQEGRAAFHELVLGSDGVLVGLRQDALKKLGLDTASLSAVNAKLVYCHVTGFPGDGNTPNRPGHDLTYLAKSGLLQGLFPQTHVSDRQANRVEDDTLTPSNLTMQLADMTGGLYSAMVWLAALHRRNVTEQGQAIEINLYESASLLALVQQTEPELAYVLSGRTVCYRCYQTSDGSVALGALEPKFFASLAKAIHHPEWARLGLTEAKPGNAIFEELKKIFASQTTAEWVALGDTYDIPIEDVHTDMELPPLTLPFRELDITDKP